MAARATINSDSIYSACSNRQRGGVRRTLKVAMTYATESIKTTANKKKTMLDFKEITVSKYGGTQND